MKLTTLCTFLTLSASFSLSQEGYEESGSCAATLRAKGPCGSGRAGCPYVLNLPPLTVHLPKQFQELDKLVKDLQALKDEVDQLRRLCGNCGRHRESRYDEDARSDTRDLEVRDNQGKKVAGSVCTVEIENREAAQKEAAGKDEKQEKEEAKEIRINEEHQVWPDETGTKNKNTQMKMPQDRGRQDQGKIWEEKKKEMEERIKAGQGNEKPKQAVNSGLTDERGPIKKDEEVVEGKTGGELEKEKTQKAVENVQRDSDRESASRKATQSTDFVSISPTPALMALISAQGPEFVDLDKTESITSSLPSPPFSDSTSHYLPVVNPKRTLTASTKSNTNSLLNVTSSPSSSFHTTISPEDKERSRWPSTNNGVNRPAMPEVKRKPGIKLDANDKQKDAKQDQKPDIKTKQNMPQQKNRAGINLKPGDKTKTFPIQRAENRTTNPFLKNLKPKYGQDRSNNSQEGATDQQARPTSDDQIESDQTPMLDKNSKAKKEPLHPVKTSKTEQNQKPDYGSTDPTLQNLKPKYGQDRTDNSQLVATDQEVSPVTDEQPESEETPMLSKNPELKKEHGHPFITSKTGQKPKPDKGSIHPSLYNPKTKYGQNRPNNSQWITTDQQARPTTDEQPESEGTPMLNKNSELKKGYVHPVKTSKTDQKPDSSITDPSLKNLKPKYDQERTNNSQWVATDQQARPPTGEQHESEETLNRNSKPKKETVHPIITSETEQNKNPDSSSTDPSLKNLKPKYGQDRTNSSQRAATDQQVRPTTDEQPESEETPMLSKIPKLQKDPVHPVETSKSDQKQKPDDSSTNPTYGQERPKNSQWVATHQQARPTTGEQPESEEIPMLNKNSKPQKETVHPIITSKIDQKQNPDSSSTDPALKNQKPKFGQDRTINSQRVATDEEARPTTDKQPKSEKTPMLSKIPKLKKQPVYPVKDSKTAQKQKPDYSSTDPSLKNLKPKFGQDRTNNSQRVATDEEARPTTEEQPESEETPMLGKNPKLKKESIHPAETSKTEQKQKPDNSGTDPSLKNLKPKYGQDRTNHSQRVAILQEARPTTEEQPESEETPMLSKIPKLKKEPVHPAETSETDQKQNPNYSSTDPSLKNLKPKYGQDRTNHSQRVATDQEAKPTTEEQPESEETPMLGKSPKVKNEPVHPAETSKSDQKPDYSSTDPSLLNLKPKYGQDRTNHSQRVATDQEARPTTEEQPEAEETPMLSKIPKPQKEPVRPVETSKSDQKQEPDYSPTDPSLQNLKPKFGQDRTNNSQRVATDQEARPTSGEQPVSKETPMLGKRPKLQKVPVRPVKTSKSDQKQEPDYSSTDPSLQNLKPKFGQDQTNNSRRVATDPEARPITEEQPESEETPKLNKNPKLKKELVHPSETSKTDQKQKPDYSSTDPSLKNLKPKYGQDRTNNSQQVATDQHGKPATDKQPKSEETPMLSKIPKLQKEPVRPVQTSKSDQNQKPYYSSTDPSNKNLKPKYGQDRTNNSQRVATDQEARPVSGEQPVSEETPMLGKNPKLKMESIHPAETSNTDQKQKTDYSSTDPSLKNLKPKFGQDRINNSQQVATDQEAKPVSGEQPEAEETPMLGKSPKLKKELVHPAETSKIDQKPDYSSTDPSLKNLKPKYGQDRTNHSQRVASDHVARPTTEEQPESEETPMLSKIPKLKKEPVHPAETSKNDQKPDYSSTDPSLKNLKPKYGQDRTNNSQRGATDEDARPTTEEQPKSEETPMLSKIPKIIKEPVYPSETSKTDQNQKPDYSSTDPFLENLKPKYGQDRTNNSQQVATDQHGKPATDKQPKSGETPILSKIPKPQKEPVRPVEISKSDQKQKPDYSSTDPSLKNPKPKYGQERSNNSQWEATDQQARPTTDKLPESDETPMLSKIPKLQKEPLRPVKTSKSDLKQKPDYSSTDPSNKNLKLKHSQRVATDEEARPTTDEQPESEEIPMLSKYPEVKKEPIHPVETSKTDQKQESDYNSTDPSLKNLKPKYGQDRTNNSQRVAIDQEARSTTGEQPESEETPLLSKNPKLKKEPVHPVEASKTVQKQKPDNSGTDPSLKNLKPKYGQDRTNNSQWEGTDQQARPTSGKQPESGGTPILNKNSKPKKGSVHPVKTSKTPQQQKPDYSSNDPSLKNLKPKYGQDRTNNSQWERTHQQARPSSGEQPKSEETPMLNKNSKLKKGTVPLVKTKKPEQKQKPERNYPKEKLYQTKAKQNLTPDLETDSNKMKKPTELLHSNSSGNSESENTFTTNPNQRLKPSQKIPKINGKYKTGQVPKFNQRQPKLMRDPNPGANVKPKSSQVFPDPDRHLGEDSNKKSDPRSGSSGRPPIKPTLEARTTPAHLNENTASQQTDHFSFPTTNSINNAQLLPTPSAVPQMAGVTHTQVHTEFKPSTMKTITAKTIKDLHGLPVGPNSGVASDLRPQTTNKPSSIPMSATSRLLHTVIPRTNPGSTKTNQHSMEEEERPTLNIQTTSRSELSSTTANPMANPAAESSTSSARELRVKIKQVAAAFFNGTQVVPNRKPSPGKHLKDLPEDNEGGSRPSGGALTSITSEGAVSKVMRDCSDHLVRRGVTKSGIYQVTPDLHAGGSFPVLCDMEVQGGGWTLLQLRKDGGVSFNRTWAEYRSGFGELLKGGEFWLGNQHIHLLTRSRDMTLRVELEDFSGIAGYAEYEHFKVASERMRFKLTLGGYSGTAGNALRFSSTFDHSNQAFTTPDRDNDRYPSGNCGAYYSSGWWFNACMAANLNGRYYKGKYKGVRDGIYWGAWHNISSELYPTNERLSFKTVRMMIRPKEFLT
ncbi:titin-like [Corythoichthys intestinalis]|uniref:titin-like n=1 Tax=Corythoichthys intestinalis TaxID=161448 RepID=UPI0025A5DE1C|nr:titin-like [Corythoichthys intestinalis]